MREAAVDAGPPEDPAHPRAVRAPPAAHPGEVRAPPVDCFFYFSG